MSDRYGWQVMDAAGNVRYDQNTIMSRWLGSLDIDWIEPSAANGYSRFWQRRVSGIPFNGGTPYAFITPRIGVSVPNDRSFGWAIPDVYCGSDFVEITYDASNTLYPDDTVGLGWGLITVHWGVYNA